MRGALSVIINLHHMLLLLLLLLLLRVTSAGKRHATTCTPLRPGSFKDGGGDYVVGNKEGMKLHTLSTIGLRSSRQVLMGEAKLSESSAADRVELMLYRGNIEEEGSQVEGMGMVEDKSIPYHIYSPFDLPYVLVWAYTDRTNWRLIDWALNQSKSKISKDESHRRLKCIDIGSNHGWYTMHMAMLGCCVKQFEIQSMYVALSTESLNYNGLRSVVDVYHAGLSDREGTAVVKNHHGGAFMDLLVDDASDRDSDSEIARNDSKCMYNCNIDGSVPVYAASQCIFGGQTNRDENSIISANVVDIDNSGEPHSSRNSDSNNNNNSNNNYYNKDMNCPIAYGDTIDFIKVDVEGFEIPVIRGLGETIRRTNVLSVLIEMGPYRWESVGVLDVDEGVRVLQEEFGAYNLYLVWRRRGSCHKGIISSPPDLAGDEVGPRLVSVPWGDIAFALFRRMIELRSDCDFFLHKETLLNSFEV